MNPEDVYASNYAKQGLKEGSSIFMQLTSLMCWDAVKQCAAGAGIISEEKSKLLDAKFALVNTGDFQVRNAYQLKTLEPGNVLGFFAQLGANLEIIHCMLSLGGARAAGNKNSCLGVYDGASIIGKSVSWESLDLSILEWNADGTFWSIDKYKNINDTSTFIYRKIQIHYRPISYLKYK